MTTGNLTVTPWSAANAYQRTQSTTGSEGGGFGDTLDQALGHAVELGHAADQGATDALLNGGDVTHVVTAISKAQLALQEIVSVRDKVVQSYQEVMRMSI